MSSKPPIQVDSCSQHLTSISEIFVADNGSNLYSIDLRNGHILYGYPGAPVHACPDSSD